MQFALSGAHSAMLLPGLPFSLNFAVSARIRGSFSLEQLQSALERLRLRHPLLAVRIEPEPQGNPAHLTTQGVPPIPLRVIPRSSDDAWIGEVEAEIVRPSNYHTGPLLRCVWLRGEQVSDLLLICDHIISDGVSAIQALRDLLQLLADPKLIPETLVPPLLAELIPPDMQALIRTRLAQLQASPPPETAPETSASQPCVLPVEFDQAETSALVAACRLRGVTVQAALCAAFAMPFAERQPEAPMRRLECPVDLRRRLVRPVGEVYGNYISLAYLTLDCSPGKNAWEVAAQASRSLAAVSDRELFTLPLVMSTLAEEPLKVSVVNYQYDLSISNLGRIDIPERYGPLQLESVYGPTFPSSTTDHRILGVCTFAGRMRCTYTSCDPQVPALLRRAREILAGMIEPSTQKALP